MAQELETLAAEMGVSVNQLDSFVEALRPRVAAGMSIEEAAADWNRAVQVMAAQCGMAKIRQIKDVLLDGGLYEDLRAAA